MIRPDIEQYFDENAMSWVKDAYDEEGYNFPTGLHRTRIINKVIAAAKKPMKIVDLGCGGGQLALDLAEKGHSTVGMDQCAEMIKICEDNRKKRSPEVQKRTAFVCSPLENNTLEQGSFEAVTAMGVIYYFTDDLFFSVVNKLLKPGGIFMVSCRNRLFNMVSITHRTENEISAGGALGLVEEIEALYEKVPVKEAEEFVKRLKGIT
ncbi:MAG: class I SAM-dependent methyltransferase, partial [Candidatus Omnitrophota bacterium]